ncbi:MAG: flagellar basal body P-ring formation chaperone FlgA [Pseudomonadota bacterium]
MVFARLVFLLLLVPVAALAEPNRIDVVVAQGVIYPGQTINEAMLRVVETGKSPPPGMRVAMEKAQLVGKIGTQTILPGRFISLDSVRAPSIIKAGDSVTITLSGAGFSIGMTGIALQEAGLGDALLVRNIETGKTIRGHVSPDGSVHIGGLR